MLRFGYKVFWNHCSHSLLSNSENHSVYMGVVPEVQMVYRVPKLYVLIDHVNPVAPQDIMQLGLSYVEDGRRVGGVDYRRGGKATLWKGQ